jgi:sugar phosphate isomerase/epimerase
MKLDLGCVEFCLPGDLPEKLTACKRHGLWLELANTAERDLGILNSYDVEVRTVQAYLLHQYSLIGWRRAERRAAREHVKTTIELASEVGARYALIIPGYGQKAVVKGKEKLDSTLKKLAGYASERGITILLEALSPRKTAFLPSLAAIQVFVASLNLENLAMAGDTCHAFEAGDDIKDYRRSLAELHLKDTDSKPPGKGVLDFRRILKKPWRQLCLEYNGNGRYLETSLRFLRSLG